MKKSFLKFFLTTMAAVLALSAALVCLRHLLIGLDRGIVAEGPRDGSFQREDLAPGVVRVSLGGEGYSLGFALGSALRREIRECVPGFQRDVLGADPLGFLARDGLLEKAWKLDALMPRRFREELRGVSDATGMPYADLLLVNVFDDLQYLSGCSSVVALADGSSALLHGRNADFALPRLAGVKIVLDIDTRGGKIRTIGFPGYIGAISGLSDRTLAVSGHTSISDRMGPGIPIGILYRMILEECRTLEEAEQLLRRARRTTGNNLAVSSAKENAAAVFEFDAYGVEKRGSFEGRLFAANHFATDPMRSRQPYGKWKIGSASMRRIWAMQEALASDQRPDRGAIEAALVSAADDTYQSVVMEPASGRIWLAAGRELSALEGTYLEIRPAW